MSEANRAPWRKLRDLTPQLAGIDTGIDSGADTNTSSQQAARALSLYIHVPFCRTRCGYCDFNTYTVGFGSGADPATYDRAVRAEIATAAGVLTRFSHHPIQSIFFGGGTPTMLEPAAITRILDEVRHHFPLADTCEITIEANPDTVTPRILDTLVAGGVTRVSYGMQSACRHVLATLERTHDPRRIPEVVRWAREAGAAISLDLIYGTPGESLSDWEYSLGAALDTNPDHLSTYSLIVEDGTRLAAHMRRGLVPAVDPDDHAEKYEAADRILSAAGYAWYEVSNWARVDDDEGAAVYAGACRYRRPRHASIHNCAYWDVDDWWGIGPGAHSHLGRLRWWNRKHPRAWADAVESPDGNPVHDGEHLSDADRQLERVMLAIRTARGLDCTEIGGTRAGEVHRTLAELVDEGLMILVDDGDDGGCTRAVLTLRGRLLADYVTRRLT